MKKNNQSRALVLSTIIMGILLIGTVLLYALNSDADGESFILVFIIVGLAILAVAFALGARIHQQQTLKRLSEPFQDAFESINLYISMSNLKFLDKREVRRDLLSMFTEANHKGNKLEDVLGQDRNMTEFADEILEAYGIRKNYLSYLIVGCQYFLLYLILGQGYDYFRGGESYLNFFEVKMDYTSIVYFGLISFIVIPFAYYFLKKATTKEASIWGILIPLIIIPVVVSTLFIGSEALIRAKFLHISWINNYYTGSVNVISNTFTLLIIVGLFLGLFYIKRAVIKRPF